MYYAMCLINYHGMKTYGGLEYSSMHS